LSLPAVGGFRYREWTRQTLPADVVVEIRKQLAELRSKNGGAIYLDVRSRWSQLSFRQRFEVASMIGNALGVNAEFYPFSYGLSDECRGLLEGRGLFERPSDNVSDTSQNFPDPR